MHVVHVAQVRHTAGYAAQHTNQLQRLEFAIVGAQKRVQAAILHVLGDDHHWIGARHHALQIDDVRMVKLAHDGSLGEEVAARLFGGARLQCFDGDVDVLNEIRWDFEATAADVSEFTAACLVVWCGVGGVLLSDLYYIC